MLCLRCGPVRRCRQVLGVRSVRRRHLSSRRRPVDLHDLRAGHSLDERWVRLEHLRPLQGWPLRRCSGCGCVRQVLTWLLPERRRSLQVRELPERTVPRCGGSIGRVLKLRSGQLPKRCRLRCLRYLPLGEVLRQRRASLHLVRCWPVIGQRRRPLHELRGGDLLRGGRQRLHELRQGHVQGDAQRIAVRHVRGRQVLLC